MGKKAVSTRGRYARRRRLLGLRSVLSQSSSIATGPEKLPLVESENPLSAENEHLKETVARQRADFDNFRRRTMREKDQLRDTAKEEVVSALLPVLDNFDRALSSSTADGASLMQGIEMVSLQLRKALEDEGLTKIHALRRPFDPNEHDALSAEETDDIPENYVTQELAPGYRFKERVIRPAMVKVAKKMGSPSAG